MKEAGVLFYIIHLYCSVVYDFQVHKSEDCVTTLAFNFLIIILNLFVRPIMLLRVNSERFQINTVPSGRPGTVVSDQQPGPKCQQDKGNGGGCQEDAEQWAHPTYPWWGTWGGGLQV